MLGHGCQRKEDLQERRSGSPVGRRQQIDRQSIETEDHQQPGKQRQQVLVQVHRIHVAQPRRLSLQEEPGMRQHAYTYLPLWYPQERVYRSHTRLVDTGAYVPKIGVVIAITRRLPNDEQHDARRDDEKQPEKECGPPDPNRLRRRLPAALYDQQDQQPIHPQPQQDKEG